MTKNIAAKACNAALRATLNHDFAALAELDNLEEKGYSLNQKHHSFDPELNAAAMLAFNNHHEAAELLANSQSGNINDLVQGYSLANNLKKSKILVKQRWGCCISSTWIYICE